MRAMTRQAGSATEIEEKSGSAKGIRWNLDDALPAHSGKIFTALVDQLSSILAEFELSRDRLDQQITPEFFTQLLNEYEQIVKMNSRLGAFAYMYFSEDTKLQESRTFKARAEEINTDSANRILFFELWWKNLDQRKSSELLKSSGTYSYFLEKLQKARPYALREEVEQAINLKDSTGKSALLQLYHQIRDSFTYELPIANEVRVLTEERLRDLFYSPNREERRAAYVTLLSKFKDHTDVLGEIYKALVRDWRNEGIKLRKYSTPISIRNLSNDVPDQAVETLLQVCRDKALVFQEFFKIKAKILNLEDFSRHDVYAPFPKKEEREYSWSEGVELVLETFRSFNEDFAQLAKNVIASGHIHAECREGKLGGAYCMSVTPEIIPFVLTSYTAKARSVSTLAHELGHAIHAQLAARQTRNQLTFEAPLPLAETASVFGEMLLADKLMIEADENTKRGLLSEMLDDSYATILRQAFFVMFEMEAHEKIAQGINLDDLSSLYLSNLKEQFGSAVNVEDLFRYEWNIIPHLYQTPFYCYAYAWGNLLVLALYKQFREEGAKSFAPRYMRLLSYGGSQSPEKILSEAGLDIRSPAFWKSGFEELGRVVAELRRVV